MKTRVVRIASIALLGTAAFALPASNGSGASGQGTDGVRSTSLLIPAKTRLIISYTRRALA
ncbi:MAG: hypothetical protein AB7G17_05405 [Phycisphaerales bacterium]